MFRNHICSTQSDTSFLHAAKMNPRQHHSSSVAPVALRVGSTCPKVVNEPVKQCIMPGQSSALQSWKDSGVLKAVAHFVHYVLLT